jgi:hypothetical protein
MEARLRTEDNKGMTWDAQALDAEGKILMQVKDLRMRWFSE